MIAYDRLQTIIPADQALANKALATSLQQIGGVAEMTLEQLGTTAKNSETNKDLGLVSSSSTPTPSSVNDYFYNVLGAYGTGPNNTYVLTDIMGLVTGNIYTTQFRSVVAAMSQMDLSQLTLDCQTMLEVVQGVYGTAPVVIPPGKPAAGTYSNRDSAISSGLIPATQSTVSSLISSYPQQAQQLNQNWAAIVDAITRERIVQQQANLTFDGIPNLQQSVYSFVYSLPSPYGLDTQALMSAWFIESIATMWNIYGQSVVACMRQGRNNVTINESGTLSGSNVPQNPPQPYPQATLMPSYYSAQEAANMVQK